MKKFTTNEFKALLTEEGLVLADFFATWCGPCKMLTPVLEDLSESLPNNITIAKIDIDEETELVREYRITSVPTLLLFKNGKVVDSAIGYRSKQNLLGMIESANKE